MLVFKSLPVFETLTSASKDSRLNQVKSQDIFLLKEMCVFVHLAVCPLVLSPQTDHRRLSQICPIFSLLLFLSPASLYFLNSFSTYISTNRADCSNANE